MVGESLDETTERLKKGKQTTENELLKAADEELVQTIHDGMRLEALQ